ncbi:MAG: SAF domain-containing protein [Actinomycetota bacterium]
MLFATAVWVAMSAFLPHPAPRGVPVAVVARDLSAGHVLTAGDLAVADWPADLSPAGAVADPGSLVGRALGAGMARGEPLTPARVRGPGLLTGVESGLVAAHVRLGDPAMAAMARSGDHVDLISSAGKLVAADVVVLAVDPLAAGDGGWSATPGSGGPGGVVVAVAGEAAVRLATLDPSGLSDSTFSLVMRTAGS